LVLLVFGVAADLQQYLVTRATHLHALEKRLSTSSGTIGGTQLLRWPDGTGERRNQFSSLNKEGVHSDFPAVSSRRVGSSILASLSEAGGDVLLWLTSEPLPPHPPSSTKRHLECTLALYLASQSPFDPELRLAASPLNPSLSPLFPALSASPNPKTGLQHGPPSRLGKNLYARTSPSTHNSKIPPSPEPQPYPTTQFGESKSTRMKTVPNLRLLAVCVSLVLALAWLPGWADTQPYAYAIRSSPHCGCGCASNENGRSPGMSCDLGECQRKVPDIYCKPTAKSLGSSDHLPQSRPAYSRKSNRTQRAQR